MGKSNVIELEGRAGSIDPLTELLRTGAEQLLQQAIEIELQEQLAGYTDRKLADGRAGVVRNGYLPERELQTGIGPVTVRFPKSVRSPAKPSPFALRWCRRMFARRSPWKQRCPGST